MSASNNNYRSGTGIAGSSTGVHLLGDSIDIRLRPDIDEAIRNVDQDLSQFTTLVDMRDAARGNTTMKPVTQFEFSWMEQGPIEFRMVTTAATTYNAPSVTVANCAYCPLGSTIYVPATGETIYVSGKTGTTSLSTIVRGFGGSVAQAIPANSILLVVSPHTEEAADKPNVLQRDLQSGTLYVGQAEHGWANSSWSDWVEYRGTPEVQRLRDQSVTVFKRWREHNAILGVPAKTTGINGNTLYTPAGLRYFCRKKNILSMNRQPTYRTISRAIDHIATMGRGKNYFAFTGGEFYRRLLDWPEVQRQITTVNGLNSGKNPGTIGFEIQKIYFNGITLNLVRHPLLDEGDLAKEVLITRLEDVVRRELKPMYIVPNVQSPGANRVEYKIGIAEGWEHLNTYGCGVLTDCL
jgi:hypothetical protein